jgi:hypothetical protein
LIEDQFNGDMLARAAHVPDEADHRARGASVILARERECCLPSC